MVETDNRVRLTEKVLHEEFRGMTGTVKRFIKSRGVVWVECDNGKRYDAYPENIELITE
ncbi:MAG: hypothetical protein P4N59_03545 [Negativicutes bacterium]|nr:hypothetical protein [Negativicutes bacterium]